MCNVAEKYKGKSSDAQVSTIVYVDMFTKKLKCAVEWTDGWKRICFESVLKLESINEDILGGDLSPTLR